MSFHQNANEQSLRSSLGRKMRNFRSAALLTVSLPAAVSSASAADASSSMNGYKCATHTHTSEQGPGINANVEEAAEWYRSHGFHCLFVTGQDVRTDITQARRRYEQDGKFLLMPGLEISQSVVDKTAPLGMKFYHVNGLNIDTMIHFVGYPKPANDITPAQTYVRNIARVRAAGGIPQVNHPNLWWSVSPKDLMAVEGPFLLEIWNAFPFANNLGGTDEGGNVALSTEGLWDALLSSGKIVWGTASDDADEYKDLSNTRVPTPGRGWIVVQAAKLTAADITRALDKGEFYASNGIEIEGIDVDDRGVSIHIDPGKDYGSAAPPSTRYLTRFIGEGGKVLAEVAGRSPSYRFKGAERYVRASIIDSDGRRAWTQPVFVQTVAGKTRSESQ